MIEIFIGLGGVAAILLVSEFLWHTSIFQKAETPRKLVHIITGIFISFWPLFMSFRWIQVLSLVLFLVVFASKRFHIFRAVHSVERPTYGELLFPLGVLVAATFAQSGWAYMAAVLHLSLADGFAALVGVRYWPRFGYRIFKQPKTYIGTGVFYMISLTIIATTMLFDPAAYESHAVLAIVFIPAVATAIENIAVFGTDNLLVPVVVIAALESLRVVG